MARLGFGMLSAVVSLFLLSNPSVAMADTPGPAMFGSVVLAASTTPYDARWASVQSRPLGVGRHIAKAASLLTGTDRLRYVNSAVNKAISYSEDNRNWGKSDYWANAAQSFARRAGDCEDYAIAKMQVLRAAGVSPHKMFLVVGNDLSARASHALLVVQVADAYLVLDNFHDDVRPDSSYREFRPVITLSTEGRWLHGYRSGAPRRGNGAPRQLAHLEGGSHIAAVLAAQSGN